MSFDLLAAATFSFELQQCHIRQEWRLNSNKTENIFRSVTARFYVASRLIAWILFEYSVHCWIAWKILNLIVLFDFLFKRFKNCLFRWFQDKFEIWLDEFDVTRLIQKSLLDEFETSLDGFELSLEQFELSLDGFEPGLNPGKTFDRRCAQSANCRVCQVLQPALGFLCDRMYPATIPI